MFISLWKSYLWQLTTKIWRIFIHIVPVRLIKAVCSPLLVSVNIPTVQVTRVNLVLMQNFFFLTKSCYENNYIAIDQNKISSILATTDNYKFSHKHIKPTQQVTYSSILKTWHMSPISLIFPNSDRTPLCFHSFHRPMHPSGTTLGVLFLDNYVLIFAFVTGNSRTKRNKTRTRYEPFTHECCSY